MNIHSKTNALLCMTASILLSSLAQLSMKVSMVYLAGKGTSDIATILATILSDPSILGWLCLGILSYAISLLFWLFAIARLDLSVAYPMLALSYIIVYLVAIFWPVLGEQASWTRSLGILVVIAGVVLIAHSDKNTSKEENAAC